jgi:hypothetical protein
LDNDLVRMATRCTAILVALFAAAHKWRIFFSSPRYAESGVEDRRLDRSWRQTDVSTSSEGHLPNSAVRSDTTDANTHADLDADAGQDVEPDVEAGQDVDPDSGLDRETIRNIRSALKERRSQTRATWFGLAVVSIYLYFVAIVIGVIYEAATGELPPAESVDPIGLLLAKAHLGIDEEEAVAIVVGMVAVVVALTIAFATSRPFSHTSDIHVAADEEVSRGISWRGWLTTLSSSSIALTIFALIVSMSQLTVAFAISVPLMILSLVSGAVALTLGEVTNDRIELAILAERLDTCKCALAELQEMYTPPARAPIAKIWLGLLSIVGAFSLAPATLGTVAGAIHCAIASACQLRDTPQSELFVFTITTALLTLIMSFLPISLHAVAWFALVRDRRTIARWAAAVALVAFVLQAGMFVNWTDGQGVGSHLARGTAVVTSFVLLIPLMFGVWVRKAGLASPFAGIVYLYWRSQEGNARRAMAKYRTVPPVMAPLCVKTRSGPGF